MGKLEPPKPMSGYVPVGENFISVLAAMFGGLTKRGGVSALRLHSESKDCGSGAPTGLCVAVDLLRDQ